MPRETVTLLAGQTKQHQFEVRIAPGRTAEYAIFSFAETPKSPNRGTVIPYTVKKGAKVVAEGRANFNRTAKVLIDKPTSGKYVISYSSTVTPFTMFVGGDLVMKLARP